MRDSRMESELERPGVELLTVAEAAVFLFIGFLFVILSQYPLMLVSVLPVSVILATIYLWEGFYRTPNMIRVDTEGLEFRFRTRKPRNVPWEYVMRVEIPASDPTTFFGKNLSVAKLHVGGEKRPFSIRMFPAMAILKAKDEAFRNLKRYSGPSSADFQEGR
jgi:hypothetical protein